MKRRNFLKLALSTIIAGQLPSHVFSQAPVCTVAVAEGTDYASITRKVVTALGGMRSFVKPGNTVIVKPNMAWDRKPEYAATTHPTVIRAIVEECLGAGARKVKVFDNTCNDSRRCYENCGIPDALKGLKNVEVRFVENDRFKKTAIRGKFLKEWALYSDSLTADVLINVPIAKHHGLTGLTLGLKNMMGIMGDSRGYIHRSIEDALCDINSVVKSHLTIIDATRILVRHGPQGGNLKDVRVLNKVIASRDIVAADAYATTLFNMKPDEISTTVAAYKRGLGEMNLGKIKVVKA
ncbi:MAG: DUF362 domain-containing protein [Syntrophorhabdaceae bacterium]|nr:DUF362 domain-containing protein [Syntrophorhabdaceae bacterium]MDD4196264.1 DUF362 domain-containing protein [Syntrophorhabdaceae bacterium]